MKKYSLVLIVLLIGVMVFAIGCSSDINVGSNSSTTNTGKSTQTITGDDVQGSTTDVEIEEDEITEEFTLVDENGNSVTAVNGVYTITTAGSYTASGKLTQGQIYVDVPNEEVEIELNDVSISNSSVSPIFVKDCDTCTIKVKKDTTNYIYDTRTTDYSETTDETIGTAAIYVANGNLKVSGKGTISITSNKNSGIHSKDNVTIKNVTMMIKAMNNGIKGNDKVTIEENPTIGIVCGNNGIKTSNSDMGSSVQHGYIYINGGSITINSYGDGIDAAYAVEFGTSQDSDGTVYTPTVDIYTNIYSSYTNTTTSSVSTSSLSMAGSGGGSMQPGGGFNGGGFSGETSAEKADDSAKGVKANEYILVTAGTIFTYTYDDGFHTNNDVLETGSTAKANITIQGGTLKIKASDDGIHADGTLTIEDGVVYVSESHESIEANTINIKGGEVTVFGDDDGVNASSQINISGGRLDVTVNPSGDTDGIDSNGSIAITGGVVITRGPNSEMATPLDADGSVTISGGTVICIGYFASSIKYSGLTKTTLSSGKSTGTYTVTIGSNTISYTNNYTYSGNVTVIGSTTATIA
ncbi:MAG: carbohydrate-binding domain-containing protein [Clostridia bacterium]|nr:carbohydrate-binding domain-containing protein [Clostridia bacterium]